MENLDLFLSGDSVEPPAELKVMHETRPDAELCPFFSKTACCRFGDQCSRNHQYPVISKVYPFHKFSNIMLNSEKFYKNTYILILGHSYALGHNCTFRISY